ncbi:MAG: type II toxin-antitoxin system VapB family antitoxin [Gammaproteobacteria bacterium]|nr:type II toxin-antitoxin system VapB family antitoxin [Gammaproteobacteria bacterium]MBU1646204.1 type II toxin-antitoxin system VapB family antitoxin [Gammaproteobacteria bacterium]MBU1972266.1 type II toxin-antitoxin system VapB family antitoxin [Gammaproteobacteria bacterium]
MRATINIDDEMIARAQDLSGLQERSALMREALNALIQRESARRLAKLAGTEPRLDDVPRRREDVP